MKYQLQIFKNGLLTLESLYFNSIEDLKIWVKQDTMSKVCTRQGGCPLIIEINKNNEQKIIKELKI